MSTFPIHPRNPERICWGCEKMCPAHDLACGGGQIRTPHPAELGGDYWYEWLMEHEKQSQCERGSSPASR
jgi:hypothetical protein